MNIFIINNTNFFEIKDITNRIESDFRDIDLIFIEKKNGPIEEKLYESSLLLIFFENEELSDFYNHEIERFKSCNSINATIIPIACGDTPYLKGDLAGIKSLSINEEKSVDNLVRRIGAYLGLLIVPKENQIFISYRVKDGRKIAENLSDHLRQIGLNVWRDENRDEDNEGYLVCGTKVQDEIKKAVMDSNLVVLIDTPEASFSKWVNTEIDYANASLVPVIPLCIRDESDKNKGTRFRKLKSLMRYLESDPSLSNIDQVTEDIMEFLANVFKRKREVPQRVQSKFVDRGYSWKDIDSKRLLYESGKQKKFQLKKILSHCPIYEGVHDPILNHYHEAILQFPVRYNDNLLIYDGPLLTEDEVKYILKQNVDVRNSGIVLLHHEQIEEYLND